jgi:hypothetical protein
MLKPDERQHLMELLRPPLGCTLDVAVGTTYSLDLISALMLPLSFAFLDWEHADGGLVENPLALLEALRRYGDRFTIFCQSGHTRLPSTHLRLVTFLEPCIFDVEPPDPEGVFHPKLWALRFVAEDKSIRYRVLCLSRNLTFDKCWDTVVSLDGVLTDRAYAIAANHPLGDLLQALPGMALRPVPRARRQGIEKIADELRRVRFNWPEGFDETECRFWAGGIEKGVVSPFGQRKDKALIASPFVAQSFLDGFLDDIPHTHLVSRPESLQEIAPDTLRRCKSVRFLSPAVSDETDEAAPTENAEVLDGLHAKLFVIDRGWNASVFAGSFNATKHAFAHNVEFMVELVGKRSRFGVDEFLRQVKGETTFADLLQTYDLNAPAMPVDKAERKLDDLMQAVKRAISAGGPRLVVTPAGDMDLFDLTLEWDRTPQWPDGTFELRAWPITQHEERSQQVGESNTFARLSYLGLTPLIAFSVSAKIGDAEGEAVFVMNLRLDGAPEDRHDRVVRSLIENREQLLRYILFLLACGDETAASSGDLRKLLEPVEGGTGYARQNPYVLETMLRALHRSPRQLERVASLLEVLRKQPGSSELLSEDFQKIWEPLWDTAREAIAK